MFFVLKKMFHLQNRLKAQKTNRVVKSVPLPKAPTVFQETPVETPTRSRVSAAPRIQRATMHPVVTREEEVQHKLFRILIYVLC